MSVQAGIFYFDQRPIEQALISCARLRLSAHCRGVGSEHIIPGLWMGFRESRFHSAPHHTQQPHCSRQRNWITFDGRLDNRDDLGLLLGESPSQSTDAGLAAAAYEKWGHSALARLIGDWSLVIWDESQRRIVLASDYMGVRALFYFSAPNFVAWSSSLKHLVTWMNASDDLDNYYIASYLNIAPTYDRTIYRQISYVPCAHSIVLDSKGGLSKTSFWKAPVENRTHLTLDSDYEEALIHLFREAIIGRLRDDDVVGCDLSGGLDSSSVTFMAHHLIHS